MKLQQAEMLTTGQVVWTETKTCLSCRVGGLRLEERDGKLILFQGNCPHKCRRKRTLRWVTDTVFIYALNDPFTGMTRYVGKAKDPVYRLRQHLETAQKEKTHKARWISLLLSEGLKPNLEILDEVPVSEWPQWEVAYIQFFREAGFDLVNGTSGGEGVEMTSETRAKMSASSLGKPKSTEARANMCLAQAGENNPNFGKPAHNRGKHPSAETKAKQSIALTGRKHSEDHKAKISASLNEEPPFLGKTHSEESRAKISASQKARLAKKRKC